jgi:hypothetical protein
MAAQWPVPDFLDAFKIQLEAVEALAGVNVHTAPPGPDTDTSDRIILASADITGTTPWGAVGQLRRKDLFTVTCQIAAVRPGAGETVAKTARDRLESLFQLVLEQLKTPPTVGSQTLDVSDIGYTLKQGPLEGQAGSRAAVLDFQFTVTALVTT